MVAQAAVARAAVEGVELTAGAAVVMAAAIVRAPHALQVATAMANVMVIAIVMAIETAIETAIAMAIVMAMTAKATAAAAIASKSSLSQH